MAGVRTRLQQSYQSSASSIARGFDRELGIRSAWKDALALETEGITFCGGRRVDLKRYGRDPSRDLNAEERAHILDETANNPVVLSERLLDLLQNDLASLFRNALLSE